MTQWTHVLGPILIERLGWFLVHSVWQAAVVALVAAGGLRRLRRSSAQARYLAACGALLAMLALPAVTVVAAGFQRDAPPGSSVAIKRSAPESNLLSVEQTERNRVEEVERRLLAAELDPAPARIERPRFFFTLALEPVLPGLVAAWSVGVFGLSLRLVGGWFWIHWLVWRGSRPVAERWCENLSGLQARLRIGRPVRLLQSARLQVPLAVGWLRPLILLPVAALTSLPFDQLEAILAHELAHVRRYDYLVNLFQSVVETLLFFHPAAWWISARIRVEREHCCDDCAVNICGNRLTYARALAALEEQRRTGWLLAPSAQDGSLLGRIRRLLGATSPADRPAGGLAGSLVLATVAVLGIAFVLAPAGNQARAGVDSREAIAGSVVTGDGKPVAGADVWLVAHVLTENRAVTVAKTQTDAKGRFRLKPDEERLKMRRLNFRAIWAYKPGMQLATIASRDRQRATGFDPARSVTLTLGGPANAIFRILDPANQPVVGANVTLTALDEGFTAPPGDLVARLATRTDQEGRAVLIGAPLNRIRGVRIEDGSWGIQNFNAHFGFKADEPLRLRSAVRVEGRLTADDPTAVRAVPVHLSASPEEARDMTKIISQGEALVVTDGQGRFHVPALATGKVFSFVMTPYESLYRAPRMEGLEIFGGKQAEIVIPLKRMVHVHGAVREKGTGKPVSNVGIRFSSPEMAELLPIAFTDANGFYDAVAPPGAKSHFVLKDPKPYLSPLRGFIGPSGGNELAIRPVDGQVLPPIELDRGVTLRGIVVDADDKPVAGADVEGKWTKFYPANSPDDPGMVGFSQTCSATARTDAEGQFLLEGIHPGTNVELEASQSGTRTDRPTQAPAGTSVVTKLVISAANTVALVGRVVDAAEEPVANALIEIRARPLKENGNPEPQPIRFEVNEIRSDSDGRFRTPRQLKRGYGYRAEVKPPDESFMAENSPWLAIKPETRLFFPKIVLRRLRTVRGRVVDSGAKPVAGASVRQAGDGPALTHVVTDTAGRFALPGVLAEPAFVFVASDGYRFIGRPITPTDADVEIALTRNDEADPKSLMTAEPSLTRAQELTVAHRIFDTYADRVIEEGGARELLEVLRTLVWLDPGRAIELLGDRRLDPRERNNIRLTLAARLVRQDEKEANSLIEAIDDANMRSYAFSEASFALPDSERARKLELLNESLVAGRAAVEARDRVLRIADIAGRSFDLGQSEQATNLVQEARATAIKLTDAWPRGRLAEELAQVDLPAALKLLEGTENDREHDRYLGRIAHEIAGRQPAEAEKVLMMMRDVWPHFRDEYTQEVCYRMATVDPKRATALAAGMKNQCHRARALGAMALALEQSKRDHAAAGRLLDEAFAVLDQTVQSGRDDWDGLRMACTAAAGLLPIVEQVDARRLSEFAWRTLALRPPIAGPHGGDGICDIADGRVAAVMARYDQAIARQVFNAFADRCLALRIGLDDWGSMFRGDMLFETAAVVDPIRAAAMIDSLPEPSGVSLQEQKNSARAAVATVLAKPKDERWRYVDRRLLHLWLIDSEED